jgi:arsenate reductase (glutaredoxin)
MNAPMSVTIYHNPKCGTSRNTLEMIRASGVEPRIIEYIKTPPSRDELLGLMKAMGFASPRQLMRRKEPIYTELGLDDQVWSDDQLLDAMLDQPKLIERPIVITPLGTRICRPSETVLEILEAPPAETFTKEDGEVVPPRRR